MGKGDRRKALPALAKIPKRKQQARENGRFVKQEDPEAKQAMEARCRIYGTDSIDAVANPMAGSAIGMVIMREVRDKYECARLWSTWQGLCASFRTYRQRIIGQTGDPQGAAALSPPDKMQADVSHSVDLRSPDERDADAIASYRRWQSLLSQIGQTPSKRLIDAERDAGRPLWANQMPTRDGRAALAALTTLANVAECRRSRR